MSSAKAEISTAADRFLEAFKREAVQVEEVERIGIDPIDGVLHLYVLVSELTPEIRQRLRRIKNACWDRHRDLEIDLFVSSGADESFSAVQTIFQR